MKEKKCALYKASRVIHNPIRSCKVREFAIHLHRRTESQLGSSACRETGGL